MSNLVDRLRGKAPAILSRVTIKEAAANEIERLRAVLLNIQSDAETGRPIDGAKLATRCRLALDEQKRGE